MRASLPAAALATSFVVLLAACDVPTRDNGFDPAVAPAPVVAIVDVGPGEVCPPLVIASNYETATEISRGRCLAIDARDSVDPQNDIAAYFYELPATGTFPAVTRSNAEGLYVLPPAYRRSLPIDVEAQFQVTAVDVKGHYGRETARVTLKNARPTAAISHGYSVPANGAPWAPGVAIPVTFDGSGSADADFDPLRFCWSAPGAAPDCTGSDSFTTSLGPTEGRYLVQLQTQDAEEGGAAETSRPAIVPNWAESPALWLAESNNGGSTLHRIENGALPTTAPGGAILFHDVSDLLGIDMIIQLTNTNNLRPLRYPDLVAGADVPVPSGFKAFATDAANNRIWAATDPGGSGPYPWTLTAYEASAPGTNPALQSLGASPSVGLTTSRTAIIEAGAIGDVWMADTGSPPANPPLYYVSAPQATAVGQALTVDELPLDLDRRPGTSEMWVLVLYQGRAELRQFAGPGAVPRRIELGATMATAFEWIDGTELWLATIEYGMLRLDMGTHLSALDDGLSGDTALAAATTGQADLLVTAGPITLDPVTSEVWTRNGRIGPDLYVHPSDGAFATPFVDPDGYVWKNFSGALRRSRTIGVDATIASFELPEFGVLPTVDIGHGSVWVQTGSEPFVSLTEISSDAHAGRRIGVLQYPATQTLIPSWASSNGFSISPAGTHAFGITVGPSNEARVQQLDLTTDPVTASEVAVVTGTPYALYSYGGFQTSVASTSPFAWTIVNDTTNFYPARVSALGVLPELTLPFNTNLTNRGIAIARSAANDSACVVTSYEEQVVTTTYRHILRLYRIVPGSAPVLLETRISANYLRAAGGDNYKLRGVAASRSPTGTDMCWAAYARHDFNLNEDTTQDTTVFGATTAAVNVRSFTYTGSRVRSMVPVSANEVWITAGLSRIRQNAPNGAGVLTGSLNHFEALSDTSVLIGAEATIVP